MGFTDDLAVYLDTNSTLNSTAAYPTIYKHGMPETTAQAAFIYETPSRAADDKFSKGLPALSRPRAQVIVRSVGAVGAEGIPGTTAAWKLANDLFDTLSNVADQTINGVYYQLISPTMSAPAFLRHDEKGRSVFIINLEAIRTPTTQA